MQSEEISETTWKQIVIDFIEPLPESIDPTTRQKCNAMLVVIDRFSKFIVLIATRIDITAKQMAHLLMKYVFSYTEFPPEMISDRDKLVWQELTIECLQQTITQRQDKLNE